jgi:nitroimidazol reductase NimA-like FMN-containing flavoprotein (pyridoxamine 5'-phosphate oxidase superfamily)
MKSNRNSEQMELVKSILASQLLAVLASVEQDHPYSNLVAFAETSDLQAILFVTGRHTRKFSNMLTNGNVSLLIDNRKNQISDFSTAVALTVIGKAREVREYEKEALLPAYTGKQPHLEKFVSGPDSALIVVDVSDYIIAGFDTTSQHIVMK